jgi:UDP-N-acetylmuramoylalanine--D-glutamate ligase
MQKRLVILGSGESGVGTAILAKKQGYDVFVSDQAIIKDNYRQQLTEEAILFEEGGHSREKILNASEVVKSPGIPDSAILVRELRASGIPVISEIEFAGRYKETGKSLLTSGIPPRHLAKLVQLIEQNKIN